MSARLTCSDFVLFLSCCSLFFCLRTSLAFLRGQSATRWPILPQARQPRSFGGAPSVSCRWSKKYSWNKSGGQKDLQTTRRTRQAVGRDGPIENASGRTFRSKVGHVYEGKGRLKRKSASKTCYLSCHLWTSIKEAKQNSGEKRESQWKNVQYIRTILQDSLFFRGVDS